MLLKADSRSIPVDFSLRVDAEDDQFGSKVLVVYNKFNGDRCKEWMPAFEAVEFVLRNPQMGDSISSAHIEWRGVYDEWGQSF